MAVAVVVAVGVVVGDELSLACLPEPLAWVAAAAEGVVDQLLPELPRLWLARNTLVNLSLSEFAEDPRLWRRGSEAAVPIVAPGDEAAGEIPPPASLEVVAAVAAAVAAAAAAAAVAISTEFGGDGGVSCRPGSLGRVAVASVMSGGGSGSGSGPEEEEEGERWSGFLRCASGPRGDSCDAWDVGEGGGDDSCEGLRWKGGTGSQKRECMLADAIVYSFCFIFIPGFLFLPTLRRAGPPRVENDRSRPARRVDWGWCRVGADR